MSTRKIITIDEAKCNGCGNCITACAEGALALVDGKARLVKERYCDGFGDCIGECPTGALTVREVESDAFSPEATKTHLRETRGEDAVRRMEDAHRARAAGMHSGSPLSEPSAASFAPTPSRAPSRPGHPSREGIPEGRPGGCPGTRMRFAPKAEPTPPFGRPSKEGMNTVPGGQAIRSELEQWPVQIHLVQPGAPFFKDRELVVLGTCAPVASADIHWRFLRGRAVAVGCPKLDDTETYAQKLGAILAEPTIPRVIVVRMEVPCCGGLTRIVREAVALSGRNDLVMEEVTVGVDGSIV
jgi:NAD-dependent dihydropyrimidine dehydrogenase PreA subunit